MQFADISELCDYIDRNIGDAFLENFRAAYQQLKGNERRLKKGLFNNRHDRDNWAINQGGNTEIQYHISYNEHWLYYGLGFNSRYAPFKSEQSPLQYITPFIRAFLSVEPQASSRLPLYSYVIGDRNDLVYPRDQNFVLWGRKIPLTVDGDNIIVSNQALMDMIDDLEEQFSIYQLVYRTIRTNSNNLLRNMQYTEILLEVKPQMILQGAPGTGKTYKAEEIAYLLVFNEQLSSLKTQRDVELEKLRQSGQYAFVQFHPAYSYEDFIRGITAKPSGGVLDYKAEDKILATFAATANQNRLDSLKQVTELSKEEHVMQLISAFEDELDGKLAANGKVALTEAAYIHRLNADTIRYTGDKWQIDGGVPIRDLQQMYLHDVKTLKDVKELNTLTLSAKGNSTYWLKMLELFRQFVTMHESRYPAPVAERIPLKRYVMVIDEINRANLPAVLGELIYALEYRDRPIKPIYDLEEGENMITLPSNLYIIGTMNTADRSVGHLDYAIRRRFAFRDILPDEHVITYPPAKNLFRQIRALFGTSHQDPGYLSPEFSEKDLMLGHSYFMCNDTAQLRLKFQYEIWPLLEEYVRDGILTGFPENFKTTCENTIVDE
ncbi:MAG: AAA family ATPase [Mucilaginibacter sp.]